MQMLEVDTHTHIAPHVDDGSRGAVDTVAMARGLAELGVKRIHVTPHQYRLGNDFTATELLRLADRVWRILARADVSVEVRPGAEYLYGQRLLSAVQRREELCTFECDGERHLLLELSFRQPAVGVRRFGDALLQRGIRPVLAHPERNASQFHDIRRIDAWRDAGWRFQLNLLSLVGHHGRPARHLARTFLGAGLYSHVGSDVHRPSEIPLLRQAHRAFRDACRAETRT